MIDIKIAYLNADDSANLEFSNDADRNGKVLSHDKVEIYPLEDFVSAFNDNDLSDLGYIAIVPTNL